MKTLAEFPLFRNVAQEHLQLLESGTQTLSVGRHAYLYLPDDPAESVYFLQSGVVKIGNHTDDGREIIREILHPDSTFGEPALLGQSIRQSFAKTMQPSTLLVIGVRHLRQVLRESNPFSDNLLSRVGERLIRTERRLEALIFKDARERIVDFLLDTAQRRGRQVGYETHFKHNLTQQDIANLTGTSRQTVTSVLNDLRKENLIYFTRKSMLIRDMEKLS